MAAAKKGTRGTRGAVGSEIFAQVEKLVATEKIGRTEAFRRVAKATGRQAGTVAANYYRVARQRGAKLAPRRRRMGGGRAGSAQAVLQRITAALNEVASVVRGLEEEIASLRRENQRMAAIRKLIGR
jgi:hypothetical protein